MFSLCIIHAHMNTYCTHGISLQHPPVSSSQALPVEHLILLTLTYNQCACARETHGRSHSHSHTEEEPPLVPHNLLKATVSSVPLRHDRQYGDVCVFESRLMSNTGRQKWSLHTHYFTAAVFLSATHGRLNANVTQAVNSNMSY